MPIRALKRRGACSANYLPLLMMIVFRLDTLQPPCLKSDIYPAAPAPHQHVSKLTQTDELFVSLYGGLFINYK